MPPLEIPSTMFRSILRRLFRSWFPRRRQSKGKCHKPVHQRCRLQLEYLEDRITPATYTWNSAAGTLLINLATNESVTVAEAAGTRSFALNTGTFTQSGGNTATGDGTGTLTFAAGDNIATSINIDDSPAVGGTNNVIFGGGTITSASIAVNLAASASTSAIDFTGA